LTAQVSDACVLIPVVNEQNVTPHTESFQALIWHLLVSHPELKAAEMKWESETLVAASLPEAERAQNYGERSTLVQKENATRAEIKMRI
jgi:hypothetical protein